MANNDDMKLSSRKGLEWLPSSIKFRSNLCIELSVNVRKGALISWIQNEITGNKSKGKSEANRGTDCGEINFLNILLFQIHSCIVLHELLN